MITAVGRTSDPPFARGGRGGRWVLVALVVLGMLAAPLSAVAAPANDNFTDAPALDLPGEANANNVDATAEVGEPSHAGQPAQASVWYRLTPATSGPVTLDTCRNLDIPGIGGFSTVLAIYTGTSLTALTSVSARTRSCNARTGISGRVVTFEATAGQTYHVAVDGLSGAQGTVDLVARAAPANDDLAAAAPLSSSSVELTTINWGATSEPGEPNHHSLMPDSPDRTIWWRWTAPENGAVTLEASGAGDILFPSLNVIAAYTGDGIDSLARLATAASNSAASIAFSVPAGETVHIAYDSPSGLPPSDTGTVRLRLAFTPGAAPNGNDAFAFATLLAGDFASALDQTSVGATKQPGEPNHAGDPGGHSRWFRWRAPASGPVVIDTCDSDFDTLLGVYLGPAVDLLTPVASDDDGCGDSLGSIVEFQAEQGRLYRIAVDGFAGELGTFDLYVERETPQPQPARCADGLDNDGDGSTDLADPGCSGPADDDESNPAPPPPAQCADGRDNDGDGRVDLADRGCAGPSDPDERDPAPVGATAGDDRLTGTAANDLICGLAGSDVIDGLAGHDTLFGDQCGAKAGTAGRSIAAAAGDGNDRLQGGGGNDRLYGSGARDRLSGAAGNDSLFGGAGADTLEGGPGRDALNGGKGADKLTAGAGADSVSVRDGARDTIDCGKGRDKVKADRRDRLRGCERVRR